MIMVSGGLSGQHRCFWKFGGGNYGWSRHDPLNEESGSRVPYYILVRLKFNHQNMSIH